MQNRAIEIIIIITMFVSTGCLDENKTSEINPNAKVSPAKIVVERNIRKNNGLLTILEEYDKNIKPKKNYVALDFVLGTQNRITGVFNIEVQKIHIHLREKNLPFVRDSPIII